MTLHTWHINTKYTMAFMDDFTKWAHKGMRVNDIAFAAGIPADEVREISKRNDIWVRE